MKKTTILAMSLVFIACQQKTEKMKINYPKTPKKEVVDTYFGTKII